MSADVSHTAIHIELLGKEFNFAALPPQTPPELHRLTDRSGVFLTAEGGAAPGSRKVAVATGPSRCPGSPVPAYVVVSPSLDTSRSRWFLESATSSRPSESTVVLCGL